MVHIHYYRIIIIKLNYSVCQQWPEIGGKNIDASVEEEQEQYSIELFTPNKIAVSSEMKLEFNSN